VQELHDFVILQQFMMMPLQLFFFLKIIIATCLSASPRVVDCVFVRSIGQGWRGAGWRQVIYYQHSWQYDAYADKSQEDAKTSNDLLQSSAAAAQPEIPAYSVLGAAWTSWTGRFARPHPDAGLLQIQCKLRQCCNGKPGAWIAAKRTC